MVALILIMGEVQSQALNKMCHARTKYTDPLMCVLVCVIQLLDIFIG